MNDAGKAQALVKRASLSSPHALRHETILGRTVERLAVRAHCFASAGVPLALLHEAHLSSAVKRLAVRANRLAIEDCAAAVPTARQVISTARIIRLINSSSIHNPAPMTETQASMSSFRLSNQNEVVLHPPQTLEFRSTALCFTKGLKTDQGHYTSTSLVNPENPTIQTVPGQLLRPGG
jgi:hypothetical protein